VRIANILEELKPYSQEWLDELNRQAAESALAQYPVGYVSTCCCGAISNELQADGTWKRLDTEFTQ
jgi:hypothetical protein